MTFVNSPFNISTLNEKRGAIINGIDFEDNSGYSVSIAGDINDDGIDDVIIGARSADGVNNDQDDTGEVYVIFGSSDFGGEQGFFHPSGLNGSNGFVIYGATSGEKLGTSVSGIGDFNNDGIDDLIVGGTDKAYVVFGSRNIGRNGSITVSTLNKGLFSGNGFSVEGIELGEVGSINLNYAGDFNNDGIDDFIIGENIPLDYEDGDETQVSHVIFGGGNLGGENGTINISDLNGTNGISFIFNGNSGFGQYSDVPVSSAGDINGDGIDDIIIALPTIDHQRDDGKTNILAGEVYVIYGGSNIDSGTGKINLSSINGSNGFVVKSNTTSSFLGGRVSDIGDINADGVDDIIIGSRGAGYVIFGGSNIGGETGVINIDNLNDTNALIIKGVNYNTVSGLGDINDDGIDDIIIGESKESNTLSEAYVVYGSKNIDSIGTLLLSNLNGQNGFIISGIEATTTLNMDVSGLGDVNNDGVNDIIIGRETGDTRINDDPENVNRYKGRSYVIYGSLATDFAVNDVNGDNKADIVVRNPNSGNNSLLITDGGNIVDYNFIDSVDDGGWRVKDTADMDGDGKGDILWRHHGTGEVGMWTTDGNNITSKNSIGTVADTNWKIEETADFNTDGKADILWRNHETGENAIWTMDGTIVESYDLIPTISDSNWKIEAAADFDADGKADILWRNHETGENAIWTMDGAMVKSYDFVTQLDNMDWKIEATADFDGDGKADILWRNHETGENAIWTMDGAMVESYDYIPGISDTQWEIKGAADFSGDGKADIFWVKENEIGVYALWEMSGATVDDYSFIFSVINNV